VPESQKPGAPSSLSHSEASRRSFDKAMDEATQVIEQARAQVGPFEEPGPVRGCPVDGNRQAEQRARALCP